MKLWLLKFWKKDISIAQQGWTPNMQYYPQPGRIPSRVKNIKKKPHKILLCVISSYAKITIPGIQDIPENSSVRDVLSSKDALPPPAGRSYVCVI